VPVAEPHTKSPKGHPHPVFLKSTEESNRMFYAAHNIEGQMIIRNTETGKVFLSQMENKKFREVIASLYNFIAETQLGCEEAYDWVCDQVGIDTFVADEWAWDCFWNVWDSARVS